uniref:Uncharacterized protein n=1 Tax=Physcomitrium patens TaxID=3218 RepID=A0A2K1IJM3_PHYPA|nr:hypothetical protein PHYPA_028170 [Physcomitrium patens]
MATLQPRADWPDSLHICLSPIYHCFINKTELTVVDHCIHVHRGVVADFSCLRLPCLRGRPVWLPPFRW